MAYIKNTWVDQDVERPKTYEVTNNQDGSITLTDSFGLVTELGTPVNEVNMNHIEDGIDGCAIRKHNLTETFNLGEWVLGGTGDDEGIYKSLVANNVGNAITDDTKWEKVKMGGGTRNIGEIVASTIPLTDAGLHLLDGSLIQYGSYSAFVDYIADLVTDYPDLFCTEADWQTSVTTYGVCGKFVYDSVNNTVRLPKYGNQIFTKSPTVASTVPVKGNGISLGMYTTVGNIDYEGTISTNSSGSNMTMFSANLGSPVGTTRSGSALGNGTTYGVVTDATKSGLVADLSSITNYPLDCYYYIVIATSTKTDIEVDIDEIATDLNGKADKDLTNTIGSWSSSSKNYVVALVHELDWANAISITTSSGDTNYTCPADGIIFLNAYVGGGGSSKTAQATFINKVPTGNADDIYGVTMQSVSSAYLIASEYLAFFSGEIAKIRLNASGGSSYNTVKATFIPFKKS